MGRHCKPAIGLYYKKNVLSPVCTAGRNSPLQPWHFLPSFPSSAILNYQAGYRCTLVPRLPFPVPRSPFPVPRSRFPVPRSPFPVPRSPFPVPRSPFLVPRSPFPVPRSPFPVLVTSHCARAHWETTIFRKHYSGLLLTKSSIPCNSIQ